MNPKAPYLGELLMGVAVVARARPSDVVHIVRLRSVLGTLAVALRIVPLQRETHISTIVTMMSPLMQSTVAPDQDPIAPVGIHLLERVLEALLVGALLVGACAGER